LAKIHTHLEIAILGNQKFVRCDCGNTICDAQENYKDHVLRYDGPLSEAGPEKIYSGKYKGEERFVLRQFFCPKCLTILECEVVPRNSPTIRDYEPPGENR
jgi:acetone carboxylase gamma subunit